MAFTANVSTNVRLGRVAVYTAAVATADPVMAAMPTGSWVYMGWMAAATPLLNTVGVYEINVDDLIVPVDTVLNNRVVGIDGTFAEFAASILQVGTGGTLTSVAAATGVAGYDKLQLKGSDDISRKAFTVDQIDPREVPGGTSLPVGRLRVWMPNCTVQPNGNMEMSRKREMGIPFSARAHPNTDGSNVISNLYQVTAVGI